jgi:hypothetical protein
MNLYYNIGEYGNTSVPIKSFIRWYALLRRIHFSHIWRQVKYVGFLYGLAEMPLEDISLSDISISISEEADAGYPEMADDIPSMSQAGFFIRNARRVRLERVEVSGQLGPEFDIDDIRGS